jgi:hypothetical protein
VIGSDEQKLNMRLLGWMSKHIFAKSETLIFFFGLRITEIVDSADINQRVFALPREVFVTTSWRSEEVSRSHISQPPDRVDEGQNSNGL